jgi:hypothetical protein
VVANEKSASPTWIDVKAALQAFDRAGLLGLLQDLYVGSKDNQAFLHARLSLGHDQLEPYKAMISSWICPDLMRNHPVSVSKAKKAIAAYKKAIGHSEGLADLSIFYCEEAFSFLEACGMEDESYFLALIRMYHQALKCVSNLPVGSRTGYIDRIDKLRSRGRHVGWGVEDELNSLWYAAASMSARVNEVGHAPVKYQFAPGNPIDKWAISRRFTEMHQSVEFTSGFGSFLR